MTVSSEAFERIILATFRRIGYEKPTDDQASAIRAFMSGRDVFVMLPTGSGKSLCFVALPMLFDSIRNLADSITTLHSSIVVVVSPLTVLMKDQVSKYSRSGVLRCAYVEEGIDNCSKQGLLRGDYQLVYTRLNIVGERERSN